MIVFNVDMARNENQDEILLHDVLRQLPDRRYRIEETCAYLPEEFASWYDEQGEEQTDSCLMSFDGDGASCSECGYSMMTNDDGGWFDEIKREHGYELVPRFRYCPNCGRTVEGGAR